MKLETEEPVVEIVPVVAEPIDVEAAFVGVVVTKLVVDELPLGNEARPVVTVIPVVNGPVVTYTIGAVVIPPVVNEIIPVVTGLDAK